MKNEFLNVCESKAKASAAIRLENFFLRVKKCIIMDIFVNLQL